MHVYMGKLTGFDFLTGVYSEKCIQITWPCNKTTQLNEPNLFDIGTAIGEHAIECGVCNDGRTTGKATG